MSTEDDNIPHVFLKGENFIKEVCDFVVFRRPRLSIRWIIHTHQLELIQLNQTGLFNMERNWTLQ